MSRPLSWTDDQLTKAVANAESWRQVCANLGIRIGGDTVRRVRAHAARLSLPVTHIDGRVRTTVVPALASSTGCLIDPDDLRRAVAGSFSWAEVNRKLGLPTDGGAAYRRIQRIVEVAGLDTSHMTGQGWNAVPIDARPVPFTRGYDPANLHRVGAAAATAWFLARGYMVSLPVETARYDLIVESDTGLQRVQVKTGANERHIGITRTIYGPGASPSSGKYGRQPYEADEIDLFFIYTAAGAMYLIPIEVVSGMRFLALARYVGYQLPA